MDLFEAGDRLAACKAPMQPIGLTFKRRRKKYTFSTNGELMIIHQCIECESLSINRVAADDFPDVILDIFWDSLSLPDFVQERIRLSGINLLGSDRQDAIYRQLYGQPVRT